MQAIERLSTTSSSDDPARIREALEALGAVSLVSTFEQAKESYRLAQIRLAQAGRAVALGVGAFRTRLELERRAAELRVIWQGKLEELESLPVEQGAEVAPGQRDPVLVLRYLLEIHKLSGAGLAAVLGYHPKAVQNWLARKTSPNPNAVRKIEALLEAATEGQAEAIEVEKRRSPGRPKGVNQRRKEEATKLLEAYRVEQGVTVAELPGLLSPMLRVSKNAVRAWISGKSAPSERAVDRLRGCVPVY